MYLQSIILWKHHVTLVYCFSVVHDLGWNNAWFKIPILSCTGFVFSKFCRSRMYKLASIMLDVALEVAPVIENNLLDESVQLRGVMVIVIGCKLAVAFVEQDLDLLRGIRLFLRTRFSPIRSHWRGNVSERKKIYLWIRWIAHNANRSLNNLFTLCQTDLK